MNEFAKDRDRDPQLDAAYRAGAEAGPPARLDDLIRAAARREAGSGPRPLAARRWQMPLALAAVLVLSVSVVTTMREQGADRLDQPLPSISDSSSGNSTEHSQRSAAKAEVMADVAAPPARSAAAPVTAVAPPAAPAPLAQAPAEPQAFAAEKRPAPPAVAESAAPLPPAQPPMLARSESAAVAESRTVEAPVAVPRVLMRAPAATADATARSGAPVAAMSAPPAPWQDLVGKPAEQWRQRILELRRAQRLSEAEAVATEFRKRFPDERLPEAGQP